MLITSQILKYKIYAHCYSIGIQTLYSPKIAQVHIHKMQLNAKISHLQLKSAAAAVPKPRRRITPYAVSSPSAPEVQVRRVDEYMTRNPLCVTPETSVDDALELIVENRISGFPVIESTTGKIVGVVSDFDLLAIGNMDEEQEKGLFPTASADWNTFFEVQKLIEKNAGRFIKDVMTYDAICVRPATSIHDAAHLLLTMRIRRLPVVDENQMVVGVISRGNVIRAAFDARKEKQGQ